MSISNPLVAALTEPRRLLSSLGGDVLSLDQDLLVIPIKLELASLALVVGETTNAGPYCAFEDLGDTGDDITIRLHCPKTADNSVRAFLVPSNNTWNLRLVGTNLENGYIDLLIDDAAADGTLEGFIVLRKTVLGYTPGSYSSVALAALPTARRQYLPERTMYPVQSTVEEATLWAASVLIDDAEVVSGARAPSAIAAAFDTGVLTVDSVEFAEPNVMFGGLARETASLSSTASAYRVVRSATGDYEILDGDGVLVEDVDTIVYTTLAQRLVFAAIQSTHGPLPDWLNAWQSTGEDIAARTTGEVGYCLRSAWKHACFIPLSITLDVNSVITAATLCPGVRVASGDSTTEAHIRIDFGAVQAEGFVALAIHRATGDTYALDETNLSSGVLGFAASMAAHIGVFDIFILAYLASER
jgi:hypothetical protein